MAKQEPQFEVGDVVNLKSGGPPMTVLSEVLADPKGRHLCGCFVGNGFQEVYLPPEALERSQAG